MCTTVNIRKLLFFNRFSTHELFQINTHPTWLSVKYYVQGINTKIGYYKKKIKKQEIFVDFTALLLGRPEVVSVWKNYSYQEFLSLVIRFCYTVSDINV